MARIAENTVIVDGQEYKPGDVIPDFKSIRCVDTREPRKYQGLSADVSVLNDVIAKYASGGASCFMSDTGEYYEYDREEKTWKLITNITERGFGSEKAYGALKHMLKNVTVSDEKIQSAVTNYLTVNPVLPGATTEQAWQIEQNKTDVAALKEETGSLKEDIGDLKEKSVNTFSMVSDVTIGKALTSTDSNVGTLKDGYYVTPYIPFGGGFYEWNVSEVDASVYMAAYDSAFKRINRWTANKEKVINPNAFGTEYTYIKASFKFNSGGSLSLNGKKVWENFNGLENELVAKLHYMNEEFDAVKSTLHRTDIETINLLEGKNAKKGYYTQGKETSSDSYYFFEKIRIKSGNTYTVYPRVRFVSILDDTGYKYDELINGSGSVGEQSFTPTIDGYAIITVYASDYLAEDVGCKNVSYLYETDEYPSNSAYFKNFNILPSKYTMEWILKQINISENGLKGKKWIPFGDSFTRYTNKTFSDGKYKGKYASYPYLISLKTGIEIDDTFFLNGRTMAYPADGTFSNSITCPAADCYYQKIPEDVDYVTIMLGINDVNHSVGHGTTPDGEEATGMITLGTIDDTDVSTYFGAYNEVLSWLRTNRPYAHVGIIVTNGTEREAWTDAQIALAKKYGYPYLNLNGDERTPSMIRCWNPNMSDSMKTSIKQIQGVDYPTNTHPNWQTHELESTIIENFLRSL
jgi:hypothetical protein